MEFLKISAVIFIAVIVINSIPGVDKTISVLVSVSACVLILVHIIRRIEPVIELLKAMYAESVLGDFEIIFKCLGISLITQFVADVAADSGNKSLSNQMIFVGRAAIVALAMPLFAQVLELIGQLTR